MWTGFRSWGSGEKEELKKTLRFLPWAIEWIMLPFTKTRKKGLGPVVVAVPSLSQVWLFATPGTVGCQVPLSSILSWSLLRFMSIELVMLSNHLILCYPLLLLPSVFPSIRVFSNELAPHQVAKVLELQVQHQSFQWIFRVDFFYDWLVWSPCGPRDSQESSPQPHFKSINSSVLSFLYGSALTSVHDYWKSHRFDYTELCGKVMSLIFNLLSKLL